MRRALRMIALVIVVAFGVTWVATGANRGWTKTSVPVKTLDAVTGIEGLTYEKRFVPGLDFLVAGLGLGAVLGGISFIFGRKNKSQTMV